MNSKQVEYKICEGCKRLVSEVYSLKGYMLCNWCRFVENTPKEVAIESEKENVH